MIEKFSCYDYQIMSHDVPGWGGDVDKWVKRYFYLIYDPHYIPSALTVIIEADEYFDSEVHARMAAIGHITLLEIGGL